METTFFSDMATNQQQQQQRLTTSTSVTPAYKQPQRPIPSPPKKTMPSPKYHPSISTASYQKEKPTPAKILPSSLIWSCLDHYRTPVWAKIAHSACSLYDSLDQTAPVTEEHKPRYREMPHYRQIPADGLNFLHTVTIHLVTSNTEENIILSVEAKPYYMPSSTSTYVGKNSNTQIRFPTYTMARFILAFFDIARTQLTPAMNDVQQEGHILLHKQIHMPKHTITFNIMVSEGPNGLERMVSIQLDDESRNKIPPPIRFPWIRMANILTALRRVHEDLQQTGYV